MIIETRERIKFDSQIYASVINTDLFQLAEDRRNLRNKNKQYSQGKRIEVLNQYTYYGFNESRDYSNADRSIYTFAYNRISRL